VLSEALVAFTSSPGVLVNNDPKRQEAFVTIRRGLTRIKSIRNSLTLAFDSGTVSTSQTTYWRCDPELAEAVRYLISVPWGGHLMNTLIRVIVPMLTGVFLACSNAASGAVLYTQTLTTTPQAVANADPNFPLTNCVAAEGCFGTAGLVDTPAGGNMPGVFTLNFTLTAADIALINSTPDFGLLRIVAARDIGHKAGDSATDVLATTFDGNALGNLFQNTIDSCPAGERGTNYPQTLPCGPNFHTDVTAADSFTLSQSILRAAAADGTIQVVLDPTNTVGRIKLFSVELAAVSVAVSQPPAILLVLLGGCIALFVSRRQWRATQLSTSRPS
jgi:hypothetical protein